MKLSNSSKVPVYTISGSSTARPLPEWLVRKRKRSLKQDPEFANRIELLQDFGFEEASSCVRVSEDGNWVMSTGKALCGARGYMHTIMHTDCVNDRYLQASNPCTQSESTFAVLCEEHRYLE